MGLSALYASVCAGPGVFSQAGPLVAKIYAWIPLTAIIAILALGAVHQALLWLSPAYRRHGTEQRLVTALHAFFAAVYTLQLVPYTFWVCQILFASNLPLSFARWYEGAFAMLDSHLVLYAIEGAARMVVRRNLLLVFHHICFMLLVVVGFFERSFFVFKLGLILDCMALWEAPLFATLAARRLGASDRVVRCLLAFGMLIYTATRVLQLVVLVPFFSGSYGQLSGCGQLGVWWGMLVLTAMLLLVQLYTFRIYAGVWRSHGGSLRLLPSCGKVGASNGTESSPSAALSGGSASASAASCCTFKASEWTSEGDVEAQTSPPASASSS